jgi:hypothetical protein
MLRKRSGDPGSCVLCGGTVVEERRYPGRDKREVEGAEVTERRTVAGPSDVPAT